MDYAQLRELIKTGKCKKRVFNLRVDQYGNVMTEYKALEDVDDKTVKTRKVRAGEKTKFHAKQNDPKVMELFRQCTAMQICAPGNKKCIQETVRRLERNPAQFYKLLERRFVEGKTLSGVVRPQASKKSGYDTGTVKGAKRLTRPGNPGMVREGMNRSKELFGNAAKTVRRSSVVTSLRSMGRPVVSMAAKGAIFLKALPFVGVFAQVAWDMYISNQIDNLNQSVQSNSQAIQENTQAIQSNSQYIQYNSEAIYQNSEAIRNNSQAIQGNSQAIQYNSQAIQYNSEAIYQNSEAIRNNSQAIQGNSQAIQQNSEEIVYNRGMIQRLQEEYSIMGDAVAKNKLQIRQLGSQLLNTNSHINGLEEEIGSIADNLSTVASVVEENKRQIERLKSNFFVTGTESLDKYYNTNNYTFLTNAVNNFQLYKNIST